MNLDFILNGDIESLKAELATIDLAPFAGKVKQYQEYFLLNPGEEHYKLLAYMSQAFSGSTIFDIGTLYGNSSVALSYNPLVKVVSYDVRNYRTDDSTFPSNVEYRLGDFRGDEEVKSSPFIFIDVDPHDGIQEEDFVDYFLDIGYKGLTLWDDTNKAGMKQFWDDFKNHPSVKTVDLTNVGHFSGTGLAIFS